MHVVALLCNAFVGSSCSIYVHSDLTNPVDDFTTPT